MSRVLYLVQTQRERLAAQCSPGDAIVLLDQAVTDIPDALDVGLSWYVLQPDLELYGIEEESMPVGLSTIGYGDLVQLVQRYPLCQTW